MKHFTAVMLFTCARALEVRAATRRSGNEDFILVCALILRSRRNSRAFGTFYGENRTRDPGTHHSRQRLQWRAHRELNFVVKSEPRTHEQY